MEEITGCKGRGELRGACGYRASCARMILIGIGSDMVKSFFA
jgi:hypothetical protein